MYFIVHTHLIIFVPIGKATIQNTKEMSVTREKHKM